MKYKLLHLFGFTTLISVAIAFSRASPIVSAMFLLIALLVARILLRRETWQFTVCAVLIGLGFYAIAFRGFAEILAPPETVTAVKGSSEYRQWIWETRLVLHQTVIPFGALIGIVCFLFCSQVQNLKNHIANGPHRYFFFAALILATIGLVPAIDDSMERVAIMGKMIFVGFESMPSSFPPNIDSWVGIRITNQYFSIAYPLLIAILVSTTSGILYAESIRRKNRQSVQPKTNDQVE